MTRGGKRPGAGRKPTGATSRLSMRINPERLTAYHEAAARSGMLLAQWVQTQLDMVATPQRVCTVCKGTGRGIGN